MEVQKILCRSTDLPERQDRPSWPDKDWNPRGDRQDANIRIPGRPTKDDWPDPDEDDEGDSDDTSC